MIPEPVDAARITALRAAYDECFGCGMANPIGLRLDGFARSDSTVIAHFTPRTEYNGFSGVIHGGIVATALDEIMAWTAILVEGVMVVTGTLDIRYRKPASADTSFTLEGQLIERRGRRLKITGRVLDGETRIAEANGTFLAVEDIVG